GRKTTSPRTPGLPHGNPRQSGTVSWLSDGTGTLSPPVTAYQTRLEPPMRRMSQRLTLAPTSSNHDIGQMLASTSKTQGKTPQRHELPLDPTTKGAIKAIAKASPGTETPVTKLDIHDL
ncbi:Hypothetical predicted protein, partial [Pelobates cultripes]